MAKERREESPQEIQARFDRWAGRLTRTITDGVSDGGWMSLLEEMTADDKQLAVHREACVDGCCLGDLVLVRLSPEVDAAWLVVAAPEMVRHYSTHRSVLAASSDRPT